MVDGEQRQRGPCLTILQGLVEFLRCPLPLLGYLLVRARGWQGM